MNFASMANAGRSGGDEFPGDPAFRPRSIFFGDRFRELDRRQSYYLCTQHDAKLVDFDGRVYSPATAAQPLLSEAKAPFYVPLAHRRPSAPVRMGKIIVDSFTNLLFGEQRFPHLRVESDDATQDFVQTLARVGRLPMTMLRARSLGGSTGSVGVSWCFRDGLPRFEAHNAKNLHVHTWADRSMLIPRHATEVYTFYKVKWDGKGFNKFHYWFRRDWTPNGDFVFRDVPFEKGKDPAWELDEELTVRHGDGVAHLEWIQNLPSDDVDGHPDYEGLFEQFDVLDILNSVVTRGAILNLDPTLKLKMDKEEVAWGGVKKGSDNALIVGRDGDAEYLEFGGSSVDAGLKLKESMRREILETAQCVVPDPNEVASQGVSSVTIKALYAPMLARADVLREQYAAPVKRMLENMAEVCRRNLGPGAPVTYAQATDVDGAPVYGPDGEQVFEPVVFYLALPPRKETQVQPQPVLDPMTGQVPIDPMTGMVQVDPATGQPPTQDVEVEVEIPRLPGPGGEIEAVWPPFFPATFDDQAKVTTSLQLATGGKAFLSAETATDIAATAFGVDPAQEKQRMADQAGVDQAAQQAMFPPTGGEVPAPPAAPAAAAPTGSHGGYPGLPAPPAAEQLPVFVPDGA